MSENTVIGLIIYVIIGAAVSTHMLYYRITGKEEITVGDLLVHFVCVFGWLIALIHMLWEDRNKIFNIVVIKRE